MARNHNLHAVGVDQDSRMQSAIRAPYPVRRRSSREPELRDGPGRRRTSVHIPQIGEGGTDNDRAASSLPLRRRANFPAGP